MNAGAGVEVVSGSGFNYPTDVWSDGTRLFVVDQGNNRILGWNTFPTQSGQVVSDPDALKAVQVSIGGAFAAQQSFSVTRGGITTAATLAIPGVTLQPI